MTSITNTKETLKELVEMKRNDQLTIKEEEIIQSDVWRYPIDEPTLRRNMSHLDEEIRLMSLALLVESKKTTLLFIPEELDLIHWFVYCNLPENLDYVPLIKKAIIRLDRSFAVLSRICNREKDQLYYDGQEKSRGDILKDCYKEFFQNLWSLCVPAPGAVHYRIKSSLRILHLLTAVSKNLYLIDPSRVDVQNIYHILLTDTYECNKKMAFQLMKKAGVNFFGLNDARTVTAIVRIALNLGNKYTPIDTITAAYMLKLSLLSPILPCIIGEWHSRCLGTLEREQEATVQLILILLKKLENIAKLFDRENIVKTIAKHSVYGYIFCLRMLITDFEFSNVGPGIGGDIMHRIEIVCIDSMCAVSDIVSNSSPEGYLPMDSTLEIFSETNQKIVTPQMVLLCSWRTVKEVSLLLGVMANKISEAGPTEDVEIGHVIESGEQLVSVLLGAKHRGAVEEAYVGFSQVCNVLWRWPKKPKESDMTKDWLRKVLLILIDYMDTIKGLCATRRSAGLPYVVQAVLSTEQRPRKDMATCFFKDTMNFLLGLTNVENNADWRKQIDNLYVEYLENKCKRIFCVVDVTDKKMGISEIKTHTLNILRALFRQSDLGELMNNYVEDGLIAAFKSYSGSTWAERNAATLLFSALIIRIFGVQRTKDHVNLGKKNKMNRALFFNKYPTLFLFILNELRNCVLNDETVMQANVQAILLLMSRLDAHPSDDDQNRFDELLSLISQCAKSSVYTTRQLAARAVVSFASKFETPSVIYRILKKIREIPVAKRPSSLNLLHGYLLQILKIQEKWLLWRKWALRCVCETVVEPNNWIIENLEQDSRNPGSFPLATLYINVCQQTYLPMCPRVFNGAVIHNMLRILVSHLVEQGKLKQEPGREAYKAAVTKFILGIGKHIKQCDVPDLAEDSRSGLNVILKSFNVPQGLYANMLITPETQEIAWSTISDVIKDTSYMSNEEIQLIVGYAVDFIHNTIHDLDKYNPDLQDLIFNFLYNVLTKKNSAGWNRLMAITESKYVLHEVRVIKNRSDYNQRDSYLRLLGKAFIILYTNEPESLNEECIDDIFSVFVDNTWIASLDTEFRTSVFEIMNDIFSAIRSDRTFIYRSIKWLTTMLQLTYDDNSKVRRETMKFIRDSMNSDDGATILNILIHELSEILVYGESDRAFLLAVCFCWSMSLFDDADDQIDSNDVFNESSSYVYYEPSSVAHDCVRIFQSYRDYHSWILLQLSDDHINWINSYLNTDFPKRITYETLVEEYKSYLPLIKYNLQDALDSTIKSKLSRLFAYRVFTQQGRSIYEIDVYEEKYTLSL